MKKKPPWIWIAVCSVLLVAVVGLGVWALSLQSDLDDANAQATQTSEQVASESDELSAQIDALDDGARRHLATARPGDRGR